MKKPELFLTMDKQVKRLTQLQGLSSLLMSAGGLPNHSESDLCACLSIVSDLTNESLSNQHIIAESVIQLSIVNDCVNGSARS